MIETVQKDESLGQKENRIRQAFYNLVNPPSSTQYVDIWVREVYSDYLITETPQGLLKYSYVDADTGITFSEPIPVEITFIAKGKERITSILKSCFAMLSGTSSQQDPPNKGIEDQRLMTKDVEMKICSSDERMVGGLTLVPGEVDSQNDFWRAEDIRKVSSGFMEKSQVIDFMHTSLPVATVVESMYLPTPEEGGQENYTLYDQEAPAGAWWLTVKVYDDDAWDLVKNGDLTGFSIFGIKKSKKASSVSKSANGDSQAGARLMDGDEWDVTMVSLVDKPAVSKATYYVVKRDHSGSPQFVEYKGRKISDDTLLKLQDAYFSIGSLISFAEGERTKEVFSVTSEKEAKKMKTPEQIAVEEAQKAVIAVEEAQKAFDEASKTLGEAQKAAGVEPSVLIVEDKDLQADPIAEGVQKALDALTATVKDLEQKVSEITAKAEEKPELSEEVSKRLEDMDTVIKAIARQSNSISVEDVRKGEEGPTGKPSWVSNGGDKG